MAVVTGGFSAEKEISILSGQTVLKELIGSRIAAWEVRIDETGWHVRSDGSVFPVEMKDMSWKDAKGNIHHFDLVFVCIHGHPGEDGHLQGYFHSIGLPVAGSNVFSSALTFNKAHTSSFARTLGLNVPVSVLFRKGHAWHNELAARIPYPLFVKPNRSGSSFGISRVTEEAALLPAVEEALIFDDLVIIEQGVTGRELACGLSNHTGQTEVLELTEIIPKNAYFDYESKYSGDSAEITPAAVSDEVRAEIEKISRRLYDHFELNGIARIDYILDDAQRPWLIEINSIPGMSPESLIPKQIRAAGLNLAHIFEGIAKKCLTKE
ncbi:MAG: D-alanine--D-alanine ligase A [Flavobacteriia bacterium]|nr:MAG: D-alanine--D-alanine ligase A [Flavobacteriia bacterium]